MRLEPVGYYDLLVVVGRLWYLIPLFVSIAVGIAAHKYRGFGRRSSTAVGAVVALFLLPWTAMVFLLDGEQVYFKKDVDDILRLPSASRTKPCYLSMEIAGPASGNFKLPRWADAEVFWLNQEGKQKYSEKLAFAPILISLKPEQSAEKFTFSLHPERDYRVEARLAARTQGTGSAQMYQFLNVIEIDRKSLEISVPELDEGDKVLIVARLVAEHEDVTLPHNLLDAVQPPRVKGCR